MVRVTLDGTLKASAIILAGSLSVAVLAHAWAATTRTTATTPGNYPAVFRENLLNGQGRFCGVSPDGRASCVASPAFTGGHPVTGRPLKGGRPVDGPAFTGGRKVDSAG
jgi:hypothetical protein